MRTIKYLYIITVAALGFASVSCEDYLEVKLQDQMTMEEVFSKRVTVERYLVHIYSYLPYEHDYIGTNKDNWNHKCGDGYVVPRSDEATFSFYQWVPYLQFTTNSYSPANWEYNNWELFYQGINQATVFMNNVDACTDMLPAEKIQMKAEARFLRAYCYFLLFRKYGPVYLWAEKHEDGTWTALEPNSAIDPLEIDRNTVDDNVNFMVYEMDEAMRDIPWEVEDQTKWNGRLTRGACMAAKARLLLYAARPLFNGCDMYKGILKNIWGEYIFPQESDMEKWRRAKQAAVAIIGLGRYELCVDEEATGTALQKGIANYQKVYFEPWNKECIWGQWARNIESYGEPAAFTMKVRCQPNAVTQQGYSGYCPSLKLVDTYPMAESGRYPVVGYDSNYMPIVDEESGYQATGFTSDWTHPIESKFGKLRVHSSCVGRDARYYASILANGFWWINNFSGTKLVTFYDGGTNSFSTSNNVKVGFLWRRFNEPTLNTDEGNWGTLFWNYYRLAEVYLNCAEACIELGEGVEACRYINLVRERAGLNKIEQAYPGIENDIPLLREMYRKERMVELAFEAHRFYDATQWLIAEKEMTGPNICLNMRATNFDASWERTASVWNGADREFTKRNYLFPINKVQLAESPNMKQNYGW